MTDLVDRIGKLWLSPPADDEEAIAAFRELYTDPVIVNGYPQTAADMVARARMMLSAFEGLQQENLQVVETLDHLVIAFRMYGTHVGPYPTPLGVVEPTGKQAELRVTDVFALTGCKVSEVWVVADEFGLLNGLGVLQLTE
jgi:hypothetical protein